MVAPNLLVHVASLTEAEAKDSRYPAETFQSPGPKIAATTFSRRMRKMADMCHFPVREWIQACLSWGVDACLILDTETSAWDASPQCNCAGCTSQQRIPVGRLWKVGLSSWVRSVTYWYLEYLFAQNWLDDPQGCQFRECSSVRTTLSLLSLHSYQSPHIFGVAFRSKEKRSDTWDPLYAHS
jgi:hypothetical protein